MKHLLFLVKDFFSKKLNYLYLLPIIFLILAMFNIPINIPDILLPKSYYTFYSKNNSILDNLDNYKKINLITKNGIITIKSDEFDLFSKSNKNLISDFQSFEQNKDLLINELKKFSNNILLIDNKLNYEDYKIINDINKYKKLKMNFISSNHTSESNLLFYEYYASPHDKIHNIYLHFSVNINTLMYKNIYIESNSINKQYSVNDIILNDYKILLPIDKSDNRKKIDLDIKYTKSVKTVTESYSFTIPPKNDKNVILISNNKDKTHFLENIVDMKKYTLKEAENSNIITNNLIIIDSINPINISTNFSKFLLDYYNNNNGSILFSSGGKAFDKGNNYIEELLPVVLRPKSLKKLPDIDISIIMDSSASMMGKKFSLAKVSSLEFIKNLKENDLVTLINFADKYNYIYNNQIKKEIYIDKKFNELKASGGTNLYTPLAEELYKYKPNKVKNKHIVIISDGQVKEDNFFDLIEYAKSKNITITTIGIGENIKLDFLKTLSAKTGGNFFIVKNFKEIPAVLLKDRQRISRPAFVYDDFTIFDFFDSKISKIKGMNVFSPKKDSITIFKNNYTDPLLLYIKNNSSFSGFFGSDFYGVNTFNFLSQKYVAKVFNSYIKKNLSKNNYPINISEINNRINFKIKSENLNQPKIYIYKNNKLIIKKSMQNSNYFSFYSSISLSNKGSYSYIIKDMSQNISKGSFFFNGNLSGKTNHYLINKNLTVKNIFIHNKNIYLILFFLTSLLFTYITRRKKKL